MNESLTRLVAMLANRSGLLTSYAFIRRKLTQSQVLVIMYHRIGAKKDDWSFETLSPQDFERQIDYFCRNFQVLSLDEIAQYIHQEKSLPEKAVVITFDDGYRDNYLHAYPILKKYNVPAIIFLTSGHIGSDKLFWWEKVSYIIHHTAFSVLDLDELGYYNYQALENRSLTSLIICNHLKELPEEKKSIWIEKLSNKCQVTVPDGLGKDLFLSWEEVKEMSNDNIDFGAHSVSHPIMTNISLEQAKDEIVQSKKTIEENIAKEVYAFSYPNGNFNPELVRLVRDNGFTVAVSAPPYVSEKPISAKDNPFELGRIWPDEDFNKFILACSGLKGDILSITATKYN